MMFAALALTACQTTKLSTETDREICLAWQDALFLPSRSDTIETARGLTELATIQSAACKERMKWLS